MPQDGMNQLFLRALALEEQGKLEEAIEFYQLIKRESSPKFFAQAQYNLALIWQKKGEQEKAIAIYETIQREDNPKAFAKALFNLGFLWEEKGDQEKAIAAYEAIHREDDKETFAKALFNLGFLWKEKGEQKKAAATYQTIQREDYPKAFARAQLGLAEIWEEKGEQEKAIAAYEAIHREDDKETFAKAQYNLAVMWEEKGEQKKAAATYKTIQREDYPKAFARAQLGLAEIWEEKGEQEKAIAAYEVIQREDDKQIFALAQWNVGIIWAEKGEQEKEVAAYKAIHREDSPKLFALAQWNLAKVWADNGKWKKSVNILLNIKRSDSQHLYSRITEMLLNSFIPELIKKGHRAGKFVNNIFERVKFDYRHDILKFIFKSKDIHLLKILDRVTEILNELKIETLASEDFEKNIAHYTRPLIGFSLLNPTEEKSSSKFRLSTIKGVNDPTEGTILKDFLNYGKKSEDDLITFISCFTFNHDSLNQFRLYGKEKGQEASGISLVFERDKFFNQEVSAFNTLSHQNAPFKTEVFLDNKKIDEKQGESNKPNPILVSKLPLYRCIYLESYSDNKPFYLQLAQREELTFYREDEKSKPSTRWKIYKKKIDQIEKNVREKLTEIKEEISKLSSDEKTHEILDKILLPLRYLVKHSAFKEEQECRIIYIASICDDKIQMNPEQGQMYVEYEQDVKKAIHKIYLSSGSEKYKDHFRKLLNDEKGNMVMSSTNPFRVKSS
ncbi:tetratricopeptide repeat protein [Aggregatibacter sp. oral taxon 513]|uniref:tetratricopeptide repeat protein n=1 Tax=Aggregatibacter sp. oral taxon 513 TaxID=712150 RepID=UPI001BAC1301|nr:tetratricopeptide repeat protein [Aggregatibacter sp. oral taxon 513]QUC05287.1 tetratricopeptide repeat protein [Aggregatibacter sp. oral taxon 513]